MQALASPYDVCEPQFCSCFQVASLISTGVCLFSNTRIVYFWIRNAPYVNLRRTHFPVIACVRDTFENILGERGGVEGMGGGVLNTISRRRLKNCPTYFSRACGARRERARFLIRKTQTFASLYDCRVSGSCCYIEGGTSKHAVLFFNIEDPQTRISPQMTLSDVAFGKELPKSIDFKNLRLPWCLVQSVKSHDETIFSKYIVLAFSRRTLRKLLKFSLLSPPAFTEKFIILLRMGRSLIDAIACCWAFNY